MTGAGSLWSSANVFYIGDDGSGNRLLVSEGGAVRSAYSRIGGALLSGSGNNLALITGRGSVWSNALDLEIGRSLGINNRLVVSNGASAFVGGNALLGVNSGSNSNSVLVTDLGTRWLVANTLNVGSNGAGNLLMVSNSAQAVTKGIVLGGGTSGNNNVAFLTGAGSVWSNLFPATVFVGNAGSGNRLVISNGARMESFGVHIAFNSASSGNEAVVTGPGSSWNALGSLNVGSVGSGNRFVVSDGGRMRNAATAKEARRSGWHVARGLGLLSTCAGRPGPPCCLRPRAGS